jgi:hypothetical protein
MMTSDLPRLAYDRSFAAGLVQLDYKRSRAHMISGGHLR